MRWPNPYASWLVSNDAKVIPPPVYTDNFKLDYGLFEDRYDAFEYQHELIVDLIRKFKTSKKKINNLEDDKEHLSQVVTTEKKKNDKLSLKLNEPKEVVNVVDTTLVDTLNREILETKEKVSELEKLKIQISMKLNEQYRAISLKNTELKISNEKISILEEKCLNFGKSPFNFERQGKGK